MVMAGYKKTEVGLVPEDWDVNTIESASERVGDVDHRMPKSVDYGIPYIMTGDFFGANGMDFANAKKISTEDFNLLSRKIRLGKGDIIFARYASVGAVRYVETGKPFIISYSCVIIKPAASCNAVYLYYILQSASMQKQINYAVNTGTQKNVGIDSLKNFFLPLPQYSEQTAIAAALSDTDVYIDALEKLIAKKRAVKQGAMQELLTGKRRLSGFEGEWVEKPLGELFDFSGGFSASREQLSTIGYPYLHYGDIHGAPRTYVDVCTNITIPRLGVSLNKVSNSSLLQNGDVVFVDASEDDEGASRHIVIRNCESKPFISGLHTIVAKAKTDELDNLFKEFCFQTEAVRFQFKYYAVGTKVTGVSKTTIVKINLLFPKSKSEQTAIAIVLSDMDAEIDALTAKLEKARRIKQGMMSELLTGRIRLIEEDVDNGEN